MTTIWKFPLEIKEEQTIEMPGGSKILCVQTQKVSGFIHGSEPRGPEDKLFLWAVVDPKAALVPFEIHIYGTGKPCLGIYRKKYLGTVQTASGAVVWHVFITGMGY